MPVANQSTFKKKMLIVVFLSGLQLIVYLENHLTIRRPPWLAVQAINRTHFYISGYVFKYIPGLWLQQIAFTCQTSCKKPISYEGRIVWNIFYGELGPTGISSRPLNISTEETLTAFKYGHSKVRLSDFIVNQEKFR